MQRLHLACGMKGVGIFIFILSRIYDKEGYYIIVDRHFYFDICIPIREEEETIKSVVAHCLEVELFDNRLFTEQKILTSADIQHRFLLVKKKSKRLLKKEYTLLDLAEIESLTDSGPEKTSPPEAPSNTPAAGENDFFAAGSPQREEKGREEKRREEKEKTLTGKKEKGTEAKNDPSGKPSGGGKNNFKNNLKREEHEKKQREAAIQRLVEAATRSKRND